jgi:hypothetical protein
VSKIATITKQTAKNMQKHINRSTLSLLERGGLFFLLFPSGTTTSPNFVKPIVEEPYGFRRALVFLQFPMYYHDLSTRAT